MSVFNVVGRLGRDAELRYTHDGQAVANLAIAYQYGFKKDGDQYRPSQWIDCTLWGKQAEKLQEYLIKGTVLVLALRDVHIQEFERHNGELGHKLVGTVIDLEFVPRQRDQADEPAAKSTAPTRHAARHQREKDAAPNDQEIPFDDDIPF